MHKHGKGPYIDATKAGIHTGFSAKGGRQGAGWGGQQL